MSANQLPHPIIIHIPYAETEDSYDSLKKTEVISQSMSEEPRLSESLVENDTLRYIRKFIYSYPTVYVVHSEHVNKYTNKLEYTVYVGETNDIRRRTKQHIRRDSKTREDWKTFVAKMEQDSKSVWQYIIGNVHFNKSLTLDVENKLMHYLLGSEAIKSLNNRRTNAQGDYYTQEEFNRLFSNIWLDLHQQDPVLFPSEELIRDSALFKASPFHELSEDQKNAEESILDALSEVFSQQEDSDISKLIFVQGAAGTGKTVLLSHLFYRISSELDVNGYLDDEDTLYSNVPSKDHTHQQHRAYILVNHEQQVHVYNQIATKLGLQKKSGEIVLKPSQFINKFSKTTPQGRGIPNQPQGKADVVLVDEAHLLLTQGSQGYSGGNMLHDLLRRSKVVIAVFDSEQILQSAQQWSQEDLKVLFPKHDTGDSKKSTSIMDPFEPLHYWGDDYQLSHIRLRQQFRIAADEATIQWVDNFASGVGIGRIPTDLGEKNPDTGKYTRKPYEIKIFDSPVELFKAIKKKSELEADGFDGQGLSRVVATYDWEYNSNKKVTPNSPDGYWDVEMHQDDTGVWRMGPGQVKNRGFIADSEEGSKGPDGNPRYFCHPWNYQLRVDNKKTSLSPDQVWAEAPHTINEVGSTFSIQGFDLNYVGVIIGPSVKYRNGKIVFDKEGSKNSKATNMRDGNIDYSRENLRNELNVLLKRGVHGLYLFAVDEELQQALKAASGVAR